MINYLHLISSNKNIYKDYVTRFIYNYYKYNNINYTYANIYDLIFNTTESKEVINIKRSLDYVIEILLKDIDAPLTIGFIDKLYELLCNKKTKYNKLMVFFVNNYDNSSEELYYKVSKYNIKFSIINNYKEYNILIGFLLMDYILLKNYNAPVIIPYNKINEYLDYIKKEDIEGLKLFIKSLSIDEKGRMEKLYKLSS